MENEEKSGGGNGQPDEIKNIKSEFNRKQDNLAAQLADNQAKLDAVLNQLKSLSVPAKTPAAPTQSMEEVFYQDPVKFGQMVKAEAKEEIRQEYLAEQRQQQSKTQILSTLVADYPELNNPSHPFYKEVAKAYRELPEEKQQDMNEWRAVVHKTAAIKGIKPSNARDPESEDNFTFSSSGFGGQGPSKRKISPDAVDLDFAKQLGLKVDDKKVVDRLVKGSERNWSQYQAVED